MKKSLVLALALVFGVASASMAATPTVSGNLKLTYESADEFFGEFSLKPEARVDVNFAEGGDNWTFDARVRATWDGSTTDPFEVVLNRYKGVYEAGSVTATAARNYDLGNVDTYFRFVRMEGEPDDATVDQLRLAAAVSGVDIQSQVRSDEDNLRVRVQTAVNGVTLGAGARVDLAANNSDYTVYGGSKFGIAEVKVAYGSFAGKSEGVYGIDIGADVTSSLNVGASYANDSAGSLTKGYALRGTFTEGLLRASATYKELESDTTLWFKYRGSEGNVAFGDLFEGDYDDIWFENVAPAFGLKYTDKESTDSTIELYAVAPFTSSAIGRAKVSSSAGTTAVDAEARFTLNEKTVFNPYVSSPGAGADSTFGANLIYSVSDNAEIKVTAEQTGNDQTLKAVFSVDF